MKLFDSPGKENTDECLQLAHEKMKEQGIQEIVIATNKGFTIDRALDIMVGVKIIAVTHHAGFREPWVCEMPDEKRKELEAKGVIILTCSHSLSGIERSFRGKHNGLYPTELVAETLRLFGQGTKVCVEVALMAADCGVLSGRQVMTIGGTGQGADTAIILTPTHQKNFLDMKIHEIVCKPKL